MRTTNSLLNNKRLAKPRMITPRPSPLGKPPAPGNSEDDVRLNRTTIAAAGIALAGALVSAILTAYTTVDASREKFSIERATLFKGLISELMDEKHSSLALLNLWQLYPNEHRIIVLAALETGRSDLVETMVHLDEDLEPYADLLYLHAASEDPAVAEASLKVLGQVDPARAMRIRLGSLEGSVGGKYPGREDASEIVSMALADPRALDMVKQHLTEAGENEPAATLLSYILYRSTGDRAFIDRMDKVLPDPSEGLGDLASYTCCAEFDSPDTQVVYEFLKKFLYEQIAAEDPRPFAISDALIGLQNPTIISVAAAHADPELLAKLEALVLDDKEHELVRSKALKLLASLAPEKAVISSAEVIVAKTSTTAVAAEISRQIEQGVSRNMVGEGNRFPTPPPSDIEAVGDWSVWLAAVKKQTE